MKYYYSEFYNTAYIEHTTYCEFYPKVHPFSRLIVVANSKEITKKQFDNFLLELL